MKKNLTKPKGIEARRVYASAVRTINYGLFAFGVDSNGGSFTDKNEKLSRAIRQGARKKAASHG